MQMFVGPLMERFSILVRFLLFFSPPACLCTTLYTPPERATGSALSPLSFPLYRVTPFLIPIVSPSPAERHLASGSGTLISTTDLRKATRTYSQPEQNFFSRKFSRWLHLRRVLPPRWENRPASSHMTKTKGRLTNISLEPVFDELELSDLFPQKKTFMSAYENSPIPSGPPNFP